MKKHITSMLCIVICILFAYGCEGREFSLKIFGDKKAIGAKVYVDGAYVGMMEKFGDGSYFSKWIPLGSHKIKIERLGYAPFEKEVTVEKGGSEFYMDLYEPPAKSSSGVGPDSDKAKL